MCKPLLRAIPSNRIKVSPATIRMPQNTGLNCLQRSKCRHKSNHPGAARLSMHIVVPSTPRQGGYLDGRSPLLREDKSLLRLSLSMNMTKWSFGYSIAMRSVQQTCITSGYCLKWEQYKLAQSTIDLLRKAVFCFLPCLSTHARHPSATKSLKGPTRSISRTIQLLYHYYF